MDIVYVAAIVIFLLLACVFVVGCASLGERK
jgi:hypothetical protein